MSIFDDFSNYEDERNPSTSKKEKTDENIPTQNECKDRLLRALAENENLRKRYKREVEDAHKYAIGNFVMHILPVKDSLEKGINIANEHGNISAEVLFAGMNATLKLLNEAFKYAGLEEVNPIGKQFDPNYHEAMTVKKVKNTKTNKILTVFQKGYTLNGRLIRPARVEVSV